MRWKLAMLIFIPISIACTHFFPGSAFTFVTACLAIVPLAGFMGTATEEVAKYTGPSIGGLLNATFGNATELIICLVALQNNQGAIVKASLIGSIIGNILLVLGLSILLGGIKYKLQDFNVAAARAGVTMLGMSVISLLVPALFVRETTLSESARDARVENMSLWVAGVIIVLYLSSLLFSLKTHEDMFRGCDTLEAGGEEEEKPIWSKAKALWVLLVATIFVAIESELLVHGIEPVVERWHLSPLFIGIIVIPIIGNAAEHSTAVLMAMRNKMDISINIAISSSAQIAMFVAPVAIFTSLLFGHPITILFTNFELVAVAAAVGLAILICQDGRSHWYEGVQLLATYFILAIAFYYIASAPEARHRPQTNPVPSSSPATPAATQNSSPDSEIPPAGEPAMAEP